MLEMPRSTGSGGSGRAVPGTIPGTSDARTPCIPIHFPAPDSRGPPCDLFRGPDRPDPVPRLALTLLPAAVVLVVAAGALGVQTAAPAGTEAKVGAAADPRPWPLEVPVRPRPSLGERAARLAPRWLGTPYRYGGTTPTGFDCSGFTRFVYGKLGVELPHNAAQQYAVGRAVSRSKLRPGDLVFFHRLGHVGMYVGDGRMIHAPQSGDRVEIVRISGHYGERLVGARRLVAS